MLQPHLRRRGVRIHILRRRHQNPSQRLPQRSQHTLALPLPAHTDPLVRQSGRAVRSHTAYHRKRRHRYRHLDYLHYQQGILDHPAQHIHRQQRRNFPGISRSRCQRHSGSQHFNKETQNRKRRKRCTTQQINRYSLPPSHRP